MQKGEARPKVMSIIEFSEKYGTEEQCKEHLFNVRFGGGFVCPKCGHTHGIRIKSRNLMQCSKCKYQLSAICGTIMDKSKTEIRKWYYAIYLMTVSKRGISAKELQRQISVTYKTAWYMHKRIREAMKNADEKYQLEGIVTVDEAYFSGKDDIDGKPKKRGRGTPKSKVIVAVSVNDKGVPMYAKMQVVSDFKAKTIEKFANKSIKKGSKISTDGFKAYQAQCVTKDYFHEFEKMDPCDSDSNLKWIHIVISNAKAFILGTFHGLAKFDLQSYLDEFCYRFNRRNIPQLMFDKLLNSALVTPPLGYYAAVNMG